MSSDFKHNRRSHRLPGWDYRTPGSYFITIKTGDGIHYFNKAELKAIADKYWKEIPKRHAHVDLDEYEIMPDHIHGILVITRYPDSCGEKPFPGAVGGDAGYCRGSIQKFPAGASRMLPLQYPDTHGESTLTGNQKIRCHEYYLPGSISAIIQGYKNTARRVIRYEKGCEKFVWQRDFYDRIIRDAAEYERVAYYIRNNRRQMELKRKSVLKHRGVKCGARPWAVNLNT
ncbi:MAG: transposase [bacterium]